MARDVPVQDAAAVVADHEERGERLERQRLDREEVRRPAQLSGAGNCRKVRQEGDGAGVPRWRYTGVALTGCPSTTSCAAIRRIRQVGFTGAVLIAPTRQLLTQDQVLDHRDRAGVDRGSLTRRERVDKRTTDIRLPREALRRTPLTQGRRDSETPQDGVAGLKLWSESGPAAVGGMRARRGSGEGSGRSWCGS